jgi:hypothetical protein
MKVQGLDGRTYSWNLSGHVPLLSEESGSQYHERCRLLLSRLFPLDRRLEEVPLPGSGELRGDFYLPGRRLMLEVHGRQHYEFVAHFHKTRLGFLQSQERDQKKKEWCGINGIVYVELPWNESDDDWSKRILLACSAEHGTEDGAAG